MRYKLTDETITTEYGVVLHRIQALRDIGDEVKAGDIGGYIEKIDNLSQYGKCWVYDNAKVAGKAQVSGNARVSDKAWVAGKAHVCGDARVTDNAWVYGNAWVYSKAMIFGNARIYGVASVFGHTWIKSGDWDKTPLQIQGSAYYVNMITPENLEIGCEEHTIPEWLKNYREISAKSDAGNEERIREYLVYIRWFAEIYCPEALKEDKK